MADPAKPIDVPHPDARPGDAPDFSHIQVPPAGKLARPHVLAEAATLRGFPFDLIRVLDDDGQAVGEWNPGLDADTLRAGLKTMLLTRDYDARMLKMQRTKRLSFYMKCLGEEAVATAGAMALDFEDMLFPSYRQQAAYISRAKQGGEREARKAADRQSGGQPAPSEAPRAARQQEQTILTDMMCHCIGNARDNLLGRQLPVHYANKALNWFSVSGNLGTQFPQAVGWSMASALKGETAIASSWIGDGTTAEGDFHAALTLASTYNAPVILNVVNNQWAISMHNSISGGKAETFASKAIGYGLPGLRVDGNDFLAVYAATRWAAERARNGGGATLIELYTYRGEAHSTSDDPSKYRPKDEWKAWPLGDPVERLKTHLIGLGEWSEDQHTALETEYKDLVSAAWKAAVGHGTLEEGPHAPVPTMFEGVYADQPWHLRRQRQELGI
ncbi:MAG: thiamine pyrophosphate-dependent enzyme [Pseudomonadota bacterium]